MDKVGDRHHHCLIPNTRISLHISHQITNSLHSSENKNREYIWNLSLGMFNNYHVTFHPSEFKGPAAGWLISATLQFFWCFNNPGRYVYTLPQTQAKLTFRWIASIWFLLAVVLENTFPHSVHTEPEGLKPGFEKFKRLWYKESAK